MPLYSPTEIGQLSYNTGIREPALTTSIAIALAESGGNSEAVDHDSNGSTDYGLWQINSVHGVTEAQMFDVVNNAEEMHSISGAGTNWDAWDTYTSRAYVAHLAAAQAAAATIHGNKAVPQKGGATATDVGVWKLIKGAWHWDPLPGGGASGKVGGAAVGALKGATGLAGDAVAAGKFANDLTKKSTWIRVGLILGGLTLMGFALYELTKNTAPVQAATGAATDAAKAAVLE